MAGTMVHLEIADILAQEWAGREVITPYGSTRLVYDYFVAGNICPDGIMARKGYVREIKKKISHFSIKGWRILWKAVLTNLTVTMKGAYILDTGCTCWQMKCLLCRYALNF